jgi:hypothetical protein
MLRTAGLILLAFFFLTSVSLGQDGHFDFSLNGAGVFTKQSTGNGITKSATDGGGGFATFRVRFNQKHSLAFNYGRAKNSQIFQTIDNFHVLTNISEYSGTYMFTPIRKGRFEPFLLAGAGTLGFSPRSTWVFLPPLPGNVPNNIQINLNAAKQAQLAYIYGGGVDYQLPVFKRFAFRLQYRGFIYKEPDFKVDANAGSAVSFFTGAKGHIAEPSIGLVFRF